MECHIRASGKMRKKMISGHDVKVHWKIEIVRLIDHPVNDIPISHVIADEQQSYTVVPRLSISWTKALCINAVRDPDDLVSTDPFFEARNFVPGEHNGGIDLLS